MNQYEAMFLFDPTFGNSFEKCEAEIRRLMERAQGEIIHCRKWDERRLAYRVNGRKRGVYVLVYFKAPPQSIVGMERDAKLDENILRLLVLRADHMSTEDMEQAGSTKVEAPAKPDGGTAPRRVTDGGKTEAPKAEVAAGTEPETTTASEPAVVAEATSVPEVTTTAETTPAPEAPEPDTSVVEPPTDKDGETV